MKKNFKNKKIIITGGTGYIGSKLVTTLLNFESKIFLLVRSDKVVKTRFSKNKNLKIIKGDILNNNFWKKNITNKDYLFHLAGSGGLFNIDVDIVNNFEINVKPLILLLNNSFKYNKKIKIVSVGSASQVGIPKKTPVDESFTDSPVTFFGLNKLIAEKYLDFYKKNLNIRSVNLRLPNVYGPSEFKSNFLNISLNKIIYNACSGKVYFYSNKHSIRDFIFIDDVVNAIIFAGININKFKFSSYYIGSGKGISLDSTVKIIENLLKKSNPKKKLIKIMKKNMLTEYDRRNFVSNINNFKKTTNWSPNINIEKGIRLTLDYILKNKFYYK